MTNQYADGILNINFKDGVVRIELLKVQFTPDGDSTGREDKDVVVNESISPVGMINTSLPGLLQMYSTLEQFINKLAQADVIKINPAENVTNKAPYEVQ